MATRPDASGGDRLASEPLRAMLVARGMRVTPSRLAILSALRRAGQPVSHAEVTALAPAVDRATAYRNLERLVQEGLVVRALFSDRISRYELPRESDAHEHRSHPHFVCSRCGRVRCLAPEDVLLRPGALPGAAEAIQITGTCEDCYDPRRRRASRESRRE